MLEQFLKIALMLLGDFSKLQKYILLDASNLFTYISAAHQLFAQLAKRQARVR